jgi:hypothetical protein
MALQWSAEIPFTRDAIRNQVPNESGVYQILQSEEYPRYKGRTRVLKIGESSGLREELLNHMIRHTAANRLARFRNQVGVSVSVMFAAISNENREDIERELLRQFEDEYWDLPVLDSQRGYGRGEDARYRAPLAP